MTSRGKTPTRHRPEAQPPPKIMTSPLPRILDEMEASIRAAFEAARRAEEASRTAREAAGEATKASEKA
ncbi:MAG: hypothetical protein PHH02_04500 [Dehalococcoidales bacterium]|nr:hypothetical protein [Dehalococcoidales bacterium]